MPRTGLSMPGGAAALLEPRAMGASQATLDHEDMKQEENTGRQQEPAETQRDTSMPTLPVPSGSIRVGPASTTPCRMPPFDPLTRRQRRWLEAGLAGTIGAHLANAVSVGDPEKLLSGELARYGLGRETPLLRASERYRAVVNRRLEKGKGEAHDR